MYHYLFWEPGLFLPNVDFFTLEERRHLLDIKKWLNQVLHMGWVVIGLLLLVWAVLKRWRVSLRKGIVFSVWSGFIWATLLLVLVIVDFEVVFVQSHQWLFPHGGWVLPHTSLLLHLFPMSFFQQIIGLIIGLFVIIQGLILLSIHVFTRKTLS